jgi:tRNA pseudouridine38-40 synthase
MALGVEYSGAGFHGWQSQTNVMSIQATVEKALSKVADQPIRIVCAGRTDRGVHATNQVIHFDTPVERDQIAWVFGTNTYLPHTIRIQWAQKVPDEFHARFSALSRRYQYFIYNNPVRSALFYPLITWVHHPLDEAKMHQAAQYLIGEQDFTSFRSADCQARTATRHVFAISVKRIGNLIVLDIVANSFLHHMVRNIAGVLIAIGSGHHDPSWCSDVLAAKNRRTAGKTASPQGLYLIGVRYPDLFTLPCDFRSPSFFMSDDSGSVN